MISRGIQAFFYGLASLLMIGVGHAVALSPVNLNPGYPTSLEDAYPVPAGMVVVQSAFRPDITKSASSSERGRLIVTHDLRFGLTRDVELAVTGTSLKGPLQPGTLDDRHAIQAGLLMRVYRQPAQGDWQPSVAVRMLSEIPYSGDRSDPTLRGTLLLSWNVGNNWWISGNLGYEVVPENQPGQWGPDRRSLYVVNGGAVKALDEASAVVMNIRYMQDPLKVGNALVGPELGYTRNLDKHSQLALGLGRDFLGTTGQALLRATVGLTWSW